MGLWKYFHKQWKHICWIITVIYCRTLKHILKSHLLSDSIVYIYSILLYILVERAGMDQLKTNDTSISSELILVLISFWTKMHSSKILPFAEFWNLKTDVLCRFLVGLWLCLVNHVIIIKITRGLAHCQCFMPKDQQKETLLPCVWLFATEFCSSASVQK